MKTIQRLFLLILLLQLAACRPKQNAQISMDTLVGSVIMRKREIWQAPPIVRFPYTR